MPLIMMWALMLVILVAASSNGVNEGEPNQNKSLVVVFRSSNLTPGLSFDLLEAGGNVIYSLVSTVTVGSQFVNETTVTRGLYSARIYNYSKEWSPPSIDVYIALSTSEDLLLLQTVYPSLDQEVTSVSLDLTIPIAENEEWYVWSSPAPDDWYSPSITEWEYQSIHTISPNPGTALYFKKPFALKDIEAISSLVISIPHGSGCLLYLNGHLLLDDSLSEISQGESTSSTQSFKQYSFPMMGVGKSPFLQETSWLAIALTAHSVTPLDCVVMTLRGDHVMRLGDYGYSVKGSDVDVMTSLSPLTAAVSNLTIGVSFPEERHEWVSSILLDLQFARTNAQFEFSVQARRGVLDPWVSLATYRSSWKPTTLYWVPLNTTAWWSQFRVTDFRLSSSISPVLTVNRMALLMDAPLSCHSLAYEDVDQMTYQPLMLTPSSVFFSEFSVSPALPSGLSLDPRSGVIWGLPKEEVEQEYTVVARAGSCNATAVFRMVVRPCEGETTVVSFSLLSSHFVMKSVDGSFFYEADLLEGVTELSTSLCVPRGDYIASYETISIPTYAAITLQNTVIVLAGKVLTNEDHQLSFHVDPMFPPSTSWHVLFTDSSDMNQALSDETSQVNQLGVYTHAYLFLQRDLFLSPLSSFSVISIQVDHIGGFAAYLNQEPLACMSCSGTTDSSRTTSLFSIILAETLVVEGHNNLTFLFVRPQGYSGSPRIRIMANAFNGVTSPLLYSLESAHPDSIYWMFSRPFWGSALVKEYSLSKWSAANSLGVSYNSIRVHMKPINDASFKLTTKSAYSQEEKITIIIDIARNNYVREANRIPSRAMKDFVFLVYKQPVLLYHLEFVYNILHLLPAVPYYSRDPMTPSWRTLADNTHWQVAMNGTIPSSSRVTTYVVTRLNLLYVELYPQFLLSFYLNAGVVLYVNGEEYIRFNMPSGPITAETHATNVYTEPQKALLGLLYLQHLVRGVNVFSFELHRFGDESPCDLEARGDYVNNGWRLDTLSETTISPELAQSTVDRILDGEIHSSVFIPNHCQDVTISFDFGPFTRIFVNEYKFVVGGENNAYRPSGWVFSGSINGVDWTPLDMQADQAYSRDYESRSFGFVSVHPFRRYRVQFTQCNNQPLPLQAFVNTGFELAELYLFSTPAGTCPTYYDSSVRLRNGETRVVECESGLSGYIKTSCHDSVLTVEDHCRATNLFQLATPVLVVPYRRPFAATPIVPFFDSLLYTFSPPLPSSIVLQEIHLSGSYNNLTTTRFTVTALYRHHFSSQQVLELRVDASPCRGMDGFNDTAHGEVAKLFTCPNNTEGYLSRRCYSGQWEALEDHCLVVRPSLVFSPTSVTGHYGDIIQLKLKSSPLQATKFTLRNNLPSSLSLSNTGVLSGVITHSIALEVSATIGTVSATATTSITLLPRDCGGTLEGGAVRSACPNGQAGYVTFVCLSGQLIQREATCRDPAPTQFFYEKSRIELVVGRPFRLAYPRVLPTNVSFAMTGSLPRGVLFDKETGVLYGVPQVECPLRTITVAAFNEMGRLETTLVISVEGLHCDAMQGLKMASIGTTRSVPCERTKGYGEMVFTCKEVEGKGEWVMEEQCILRANYWRDFCVELAVALCCIMGIVIAVCALLVFVRMILYRSLKTLPRNTFNIEMVNLSVKPVHSKTK